MTRLAIIFVATFCFGAVISVAIRTKMHQPYAMVNPLPAPGPSDQVQAASAISTSHEAPVNTICTICGMPVNLKLGTALYQEKRIGFGCKSCPAQFAADPEKYGPGALKNVVTE